MKSKYLKSLFARRRSVSAPKRSSRIRRENAGFESLEKRQLMAADLSTFLTLEHVDINLARVDGVWSLGPRNSDEIPGIQYANDGALMYVGSPARLARPGSSDFNFIGVGAGEDFYLLPQSQDPELLYLGFAGYGLDNSVDIYNAAAQSKGRVSGNARWAQAALTALRHYNPDGTAGTGHFSLWQTGSFGGATVFMSSFDDGVANPNASGLDVTDGISSDDVMWIGAGGHAHFNFGFTQPGRYEVDMKLSAYFGSDGNNTTPNTAGYSESLPITIYFSVMSVGQLEFESASYSVNESAGTASIDVIRTGGSDGRITVDYATSNGTALAGSDYTATSGTLVFLDGQTRQTITIPIIDDALAEGDETFTVQLSAPGPVNMDDYLKDYEADANGLLGSTTSTTITILANDQPNSAPVAVADLYRIAPGNTLRGNVLLNDSDVDGDTLTASLVNSATKGALTFSSNGAFTYVPDSTFNGTDQFSYRATDGDLESEIVLVTINLAGDQRFDAALTDDHVDIGIGFEAGAWDLHIHDEHSDQEYDPYRAVLHVGAAAITTRAGESSDSAFDFLGVAVGESFYVLPQTPNPDLIYLGIATEEIAVGAFQGDLVTLHLKAVNGPGHVSIWETTVTGPDLKMATVDGITAADRLLISANTHLHFNYAFSARGSYEITLEAVATLPDGTVSSSGDVTYRFVVNSPANAVDDTFTVTEDMILSVGAVGGLLANDIDPDGDALRAALVQGPANGRVTVNPDGSFVYVPNANFFGTDTFTYTTTDVRYRIVPLGTLGGNSSFALDVNNQRQVSGNSNNSALTGNPLQAYLWQNGVFTPLGVLPGTGTNNFSRGYAINDDGTVVGESDNNASMAFVYENNLMSGLTRLAGDNFRGVAHDVNNSSEIVGISSNGTVSRPTMWTFDGTNYVAADLGTIAGTATSTGRAWAINEDGLVVGLSHNAEGISQATLWNGAAITNLTSLGNGARFSQAYGLNNNGLIVGSSSTGQTVGELIGTSGTTGITRAFVWENGEIAELLPHNFYAPGNTGATTNYHSVAMDVNDVGLIVGNSQRISGSAAIATLWMDGASMDLNALVPAGSGWVLRSAEGVNGGGDIVGFGSFGGFTRAFMLVPEVVSPNGQPFSNVATVTITVAGVQDAPEATDDTYLALPGNSVLGNVLLNDYEPDGDTMTASIATQPAHGTAILNSNGSFVYTPSESFTGLDSFTYTVSDGMGGTDTATVTIETASMPSFTARLRSGHMDIGVAFGVHEHDDGHGHSHGSTEGVWDLHIHTHDPDAEYEPSEALFYVGRAAMGVRGVADAAYDFLGVPVGGTLFILPENENTSLPFLGISGEELGEGLLAGDIAKLQLVAVAGPGDFSIWQAGLTPSTPRLIMATADGIDGSDVLDVVAGTHAHMNFAFTKQGFYEVTFVASGVDADGHATESGPVTYYFFVTDGLVPFAMPVDYAGGLSTSSFQSVMADFNGDGILDIVSGNSGTDTLGFWQGTDGGRFLPQRSINAGSGFRTEGIAFADYDGDGDLDIIALELTSVANTGTITLFRNDGTATFTREVLASGLPNSFRVAVGDLNGDGRPDIVSAKGSTTLAYRLQQESGELGPEVVLPQTFTSFGRLYLGDINNDGHLDIVASNRATTPNNYVSIFTGNGDGTFGTAQNVTTGTFPTHLDLTDMNGDGRPDLVVSDTVGSSRLGYYPQQPDGSFSTRVALFDGITQLNSMTVADINGDGIPDIVASVVRGSFRMEWSPGLGDGQYGTPIFLADDAFSYSMHAVDIDGDGDADIVRLGNTSVDRPGSLGVLINQTGENPMVLLPPAARLRVLGDPIDLGVYFGFPITVTGSPRIALQVGSEVRYATYLSGSGTPTLRFRYVVTNTDVDLDGVQLASNLIDLNGGTLTDPLGGAAVLEFPNLTFDGVIANGAGPLVQSITRLDERSTDAGEVRFQIQFTELVTDVDASDFEVRNTEGDLTGTGVVSISGSGAVYEVTVSTGTGSGTLGLSVKDSASINDLDGDILAKGFHGGQVYTIRQQPLPAIDVYYTNGHADYRPLYNDGEFSYILRPDAGLLPQNQYPSDGVYAYADSNAKVTRPATANYDFLGVAPGESVYVLPSNNNPSLPYLGLSGESLTLGQFALYRPDDSRLAATPREYVKVQMVDMRSSSGGDFSMYSISGGNPVVWMASSDGISETDNFWLYRTHFHRNIAFSKPGIYEIDVFISGYLDSNANGALDPLTDTYVESGIFTMVFNVDTLGARDDKFFVVEGKTLSGDVSANDQWDAGFGTFTASVVTPPANGTLVLQANGTFTYEPNAGFVGADSFVYRLSNERGGFTTARASIQVTANSLVPFAIPANFPGVVATRSNALAAADFNGDGYADLVSAGGLPASLALLKGNGDSTFQAEIPLNAGSSLYVDNIFAVDFDADGDIDIFTSEFDLLTLAGEGSNGQIALYLNDGNGNFTRQTILGGLTRAQTVFVAGDLNGDGRADFIRNANATTLVYYESLPSGEYAPPKVISSTLTGLGFGSIRLDDVSGDGSLDILAYDSSSQKLSIFRNDGAGNFGNELQLTFAAPTSISAWADITGDGLPDILATDGPAVFYAQNPDGSFGARSELQLGNNFPRLFPADLNQDGVVDLVISEGSSLRWASGQGNATFAAPQLLRASTNAVSVIIRDLDGDGDQDITIGTSTSGQPITVLKNLTGENPMQLVPPASRSYVNGDRIDMQVHFGFPITVTGSPTIALQVGSEVRYATYLSGSGTPTLRFRYTVTPTDVDQDGIQLASNVIDLNGGTMLNPEGGDAVLTFPNVTLNGVFVNGAGPLVEMISRLDNAATSAESVRFSVRFAEDVVGVDIADFDVVMNSGDLTGAAVIAVSGSGSLYEVTVSTGTGSGTLGLNVKRTASIWDSAGDPLGKEYVGGQVYTVRKQTLPAIDTFYTSGHADYRPVYAGGEFSYVVDADPGVLPEQLYPSDAVITYADSKARVNRSASSAFNFLGVAAGDPLYVLPTNNVPGLPYLGFSGESLIAGTFAAYRPADTRITSNTPQGYLKVQMVDMRSSSNGDFSVYTIVSGNPRVWMATSDGLSSSDNIWLRNGTHSHFNLAFSKPGVYEVDVVISGYLDSNGNGTYDPIIDPYVESGIKTMVFHVDTLGARDDVFSISGTDALRGSVTLNDEWAEGFGSYTASVQSTTTKGTLALQPNGSFTYQPSPTFDGSDSFTYRLTNERGGFTTATVTLSGLARPDFESVLATGHADIGVNFEEGRWDLHIHDGENDVEYEPHEALLYVGSSARTLRTGAAADAAFDFLGAPAGSAIFVLPEVENPSLLFLGIGGEELAEGLLANDLARLQLVSVSGPGEFSVWQAGLTPTTPRLLMATSDGLDASDKFDVIAGSHAHVNFAFTKLGFYAVTFVASGIDAAGMVTSSGPVTYYFQVGNTVESLDVQNGQPQRSFVRNVDLLLGQDDNLEDLLAAGRVQVTKFDLNGENGTALAASAFSASVEGQRLKLDFGVQGVGGNRNSDAGDGYYRVGLDIDGDGSADVYKHFYRLLGDVNGDRQVNALDRLLVMRGNVPGSPSVDVNGDGVVNAVDLTLVTRAQGKRLGSGLWVDD